MTTSTGRKSPPPPVVKHRQFNKISPPPTLRRHICMTPYYIQDCFISEWIITIPQT